MHDFYASVTIFELETEQVWCDDNLYLVKGRASQNDVVGRGHIDGQEIYLLVPGL